MPLLTGKDKTFVENAFQEITRPVRLVMFTQSFECQYCKETREIVEELTALSPNVSAEIRDFVEEGDVADSYGVSQIPAIAILEDGDQPKDFGIRIYGIPSGYEFSALIEDIVMVGRGDSGLERGTREALAGLKDKVHLQVFVTPTCPFCPRAVHLAHQFAYESPMITADGVEAIEFPHLAGRYNVRGVPRTVINEEYFAEGAVPEHHMLHQVLEAVGMEHVH